MAGSFYLVIGTLSIRILSATSKKKKKIKLAETKGKIQRKNTMDPKHGSVSLSEWSQWPQCPCSAVFSWLQPQVDPSHCCKMVGSKQNQKKIVCSGVFILRKKEICPHSPSVGSSFCLIVRNGSHVPSCSMANEKIAVTIAGFFNQDSQLLHQQSGMFATRTHWREKGRIGEDDVGEWGRELGGMSLEISN